MNIIEIGRTADAIRKEGIHVAGCIGASQWIIRTEEVGNIFRKVQ
tara:strand:+ start:171 stop:305 length:135 start_codon:yes stop_codon:yes gene_type:complete